MLELPLLAARVHADITLTHNFTPIWGRSAVFVQDFIFKTNPEWFSRKERLYFELMPRSLRLATHVFASTHAEARRIGSIVPSSSIPTVVGLGLPRGIAHASPAPVASLTDLEGFALIVGRLNARKNLNIALEGALLSGTITPLRPVIVVGQPSGRGIELSPQVATAVADGSVRFLGFVSDAELIWLYKTSDLFVFPSRDEGFGLPNLEAMSVGARIVASDIPVFREVLGHRAGFFDPTSAPSISTAIEAAIDEVTPVNPIAPAALGFSWRFTVERMRHAILASGIST